MFNQPLNNWKVDNVTDMSVMFFRCISFNQDSSMWNVQKVTRCFYLKKGGLLKWKKENVNKKPKFKNGCEALELLLYTQVCF